MLITVSSNSCRYREERPVAFPIACSVLCHWNDMRQFNHGFMGL